jgi:hypothetical protein
MICCRNASREPPSLDFHHFFIVSEKDEEALVGKGGSCEMGLGVCGTPSRIGVNYSFTSNVLGLLPLVVLLQSSLFAESVEMGP